MGKGRCGACDGGQSGAGKSERGSVCPVSLSLARYRLRHSSTSVHIAAVCRSKFPGNMKVVAAYLLALLGGNPAPSAKDLTSILGSVGAEADDERISFLLKELDGKDITEVIASGREKFASVPSGGGGGGVVVASSGGGGGAAAAPAEEKEEKKEEEAKEESDDDMGFSLFD